MGPCHSLSLSPSFPCVKTFAKRQHCRIPPRFDKRARPGLWVGQIDRFWFAGCRSLALCSIDLYFHWFEQQQKKKKYDDILFCSWAQCESSLSEWRLPWIRYLWTRFHFFLLRFPAPLKVNELFIIIKRPLLVFSCFSLCVCVLCVYSFSQSVLRLFIHVIIFNVCRLSLLSNLSSKWIWHKLVAAEKYIYVVNCEIFLLITFNSIETIFLAPAYLFEPLNIRWPANQSHRWLSSNSWTALWFGRVKGSQAH